MKNLAIIIRALDHGGAERCASNMSIELSSKYNVHLILFDGSEKMYPYGGTLHDLAIPPSENMVRKLFNLRKRIAAVKKIKRECNIDYSISLLDGANLVNVGSRVNDKVIVSIRNYQSFEKKSTSSKKRLTKYCSKADVVVALSKTVGLDLAENFEVDSRKIVPIYNSVDHERLAQLAAQSVSLDLDKPYIVTMGRLTKQKGHSHLIRAFKKVSDKIKDLNLVILGQGEDEERLKLLTSELGISDRVIFPGYIKNPHGIIAKSEFFVMPSIYEGLGNVILEALSCGKLVISTDCLAGPREILAPNSDLHVTVEGISQVEYAQYGILVPPFKDRNVELERLELDHEENILADVIVEVLRNRNIIENYEKLARECVKNFSSEKIVADWDAMLQNITNM